MLEPPLQRSIKRLYGFIRTQVKTDAKKEEVVHKHSRHVRLSSNGGFDVPDIQQYLIQAKDKPDRNAAADAFEFMSALASALTAQSNSTTGASSTSGSEKGTPGVSPRMRSSQDSEESLDADAPQGEPEKTPLSAVELILMCNRIMEAVSTIDLHFEPIFPKYVDARSHVRTRHRSTAADRDA